MSKTPDKPTQKKGFLHFFGRNIETIRTASATIGRLEEEQQTLRKKQAGRKRRIEEEIVANRRMSRMAFLRILGGAGALVALTGGAALLATSKSSKQEDLDEKAETMPASPRGTLPSSEETAESMNVEQTRAIYDRGFKKITETVPDDPSLTQNPVLQSLSIIKGFRRDNVIWAVRKGDRYVAAEGGHNVTAYLCITPRNHPSYDPNDSFVKIGPRSDGKHFLDIKEADITEEWAGLILAHELSHLRDKSTGAEPNFPNREQYLLGEVRAYITELSLVDHMTNNAYMQNAKYLLQELNITSIDDLARIAATGDEEKIDLIIRRLDPLITTERPKSEGEAAMRVGFFIISLGLIFNITRNLPPQQRYAEDLSTIEAIMNSDDTQGANIPRR